MLFWSSFLLFLQLLSCIVSCCSRDETPGTVGDSLFFYYCLFFVLLLYWILSWGYFLAALPIKLLGNRSKIQTCKGIEKKVKMEDNEMYLLLFLLRRKSRESLQRQWWRRWRDSRIWRCNCCCYTRGNIVCLERLDCQLVPEEQQRQLETIEYCILLVYCLGLRIWCHSRRCRYDCCWQNRKCHKTVRLKGINIAIKTQVYMNKRHTNTSNQHNTTDNNNKKRREGESR